MLLFVLAVIIINTFAPNTDRKWHTLCCWKCQKLTKICNMNMPIIWHFCRAVSAYIAPLHLVCCVNPIERGGFEYFHKRTFPVPGFFTYCRDSFIGCYIFCLCVCVFFNLLILQHAPLHSNTTCFALLQL